MRKLNYCGTVGFPMYLLVVIITTSLIIGIFSMSLFNMINQTKKEDVKKEIEKIVSEAENMFEYADAGTKKTINIDFSDALSFTVFGSLPNNGINLPNTYDIDEKTSNNYYYVLDDGEINSYSSHVRFSSNDTSKISILSQGSYDIVLKLVNTGGKSFVKIYPKQ